MSNATHTATIGRRVRPLLIREDVHLPIYWLNEEWAVTDFGIESLCPESDYWIDKPRLGLVREGHADWPAQMEDKGWTDPRLFVEAFFKALEIHEVQHSFNRNEEEARAAEAADQLVAYRELSRRRAERNGGIAFTDIADIGSDEDEIDQLISEGFKAPPFPESCIKR